MFNWNITEMTGYQPITTYYQDFSIADLFGEQAIKDTYKTARETYVDYKWLTELVMVLNWKLWEHYQKNNFQLARLYDALWKELQDFAYKTLEGEELKYFVRTID